MGLLDGKNIVITGAAQGMGAEHARRCVGEGARVLLTDLQDEEGRELASEIGSKAVFVHQDVTSADDWEHVAKSAIENFGQIDGLVNNAAIWWTESILNEDADRFRKMLDVNVIGTWLGVRAIAPYLRDAGGGSIVNLSSIAGMRGIPQHTAYGTSKWAVRGLSKVAAIELGDWNIRVNTIHPGAIEGTGMFKIPASEFESVFERQPFKRPGESGEVSGVVIFLLSDHSSYVTGQEHVVDGGRIAT